MKKEIIIGVASVLITLVAVYLLLPQNQVPGVLSGDASKSSFLVEQAAREDEGGSLLSYSLSMTIEVLSLETAESQAKAIISDSGGYLVGATGTYDHQNRLILQFKVPTERRDEVSISLKALGELDEESLSVYDIKSEHDDVAARIESLTAERSRLLDLFDRANETSDLVEISSRLSYVDSQLTYLSLRKAELDKKVEFTSISVTLDEKMNPVSRFVFVGMASLVEEFSSGFNSSLGIMSRLFGLSIPLAAIATMALAAIVIKRRVKKKKH